MIQYHYCVETLKKAILAGCADFKSRVKRKEDPHYSIDQSAKVAAEQYRKEAQEGHKCSPSNHKLKRDWMSMGLWPPHGLETKKLKQWMRQLLLRVSERDIEIVASAPAVTRSAHRQELIVTVRKLFSKMGTPKGIANELNKRNIKRPNNTPWSVHSVYYFLRDNCPEIKFSRDKGWVDTSKSSSKNIEQEHINDNSPGTL